MYQEELFELLYQGIILLDSEGRIISINKAGEEILGVSAGEIVGLPIAGSFLTYKSKTGAILTKEFHPVVQALQLHQNISKTILGVENPRSHKTNWIECEVIHRKNQKASDPWTLLLCFRNITETLEIEERYKAIFEKSPFLIVLNDTELGTYCDVNEKFCEFMNAKKEAFLDKTAVELGFLGDPKIDDELKNILITQGKIEQYELTHLSSSGNEITSIIWTQMIEILGRSYSLTTLEDITARKNAEREVCRSEAKYRGLYHQMFDAFVRVNMEGRILETNQAYRDLTGYSGGELRNMSYGDLTPEKWRMMEQEIIKSQVLPSGHSELYEKEYIRKDGSIVPIELRTSLEIDENSVPVGMWAIIRDLSDRKKSFNALNESREKLRALAAYLQNIREEERTVIAREIHDELGHLLTVLKIDLEECHSMADQEISGIDEKIKPMIDMVDSGIDTVRRIASELRPGILDHFGLIAAIEWLMQQFQRRTRIRFEYNFASETIDLPRTVSSAVFRIFQEIFTNVARHSKASVVKIEMLNTGHSVKFTIRDNGIGFDPDRLPPKASLGILGMEERALSIGADFRIISNSGNGTEISLTLNPVLVEKHHQ